MLHRCNPYVENFKQLAQLPNVGECRLLLKERPINQPQYNLSSASQVAAIIVGGDDESIQRGRDINVIRHDGNLKKAGRLLQQYVVDNYMKIESGVLRWIRQHQLKDIRAEVYQGLQDALHVGETKAENVGKRTILPSTFIGSRRDMTQRYEDGMAIVLRDGKPYIFLTMTCNPSWTEITSELLPFQTPQDRPDLLTRIFRSKFEQLKDNVINKGVLGKVKSYMYVTEFQKRGLPHVHMLLFLDSNDKLRDPEEYDSVVRAEIPKLESEPHLHVAVPKHMIHGPCGVLNESSPCMKDGHCKKRYPKEFLDETRRGNDSYPQYRRRCSVCSDGYDVACHHHGNLIIAEFLIRIGDGVEPTKPDDMVKIPPQIAIPWEGEHSIQIFIGHIFPQLELHGWDASYMTQRAILTPKNDDVQKLNDILINQFPGEEHNFLSFDEVEGDTHNLYQQELLNSITQGGLPPHILKLKKGAPLMLLRNLDPRYGLCNGTRLLCHGLFMNMLDVEILTGSNAGKRAFLPRIKLKTSASSGLPFVLRRKQFPVRLSFAITINKSQGQTIPNVGIYLTRHVFSHGQLYVALSSGVSQNSTKVHRLRVYSIGWGATVITDNTQL
ncbi:hypothetical protein TSUD_185190 [Trifolium subterraneum]|uniref:Uncharacterized protein n=1 Tax=Trifolium subterraneum TaxID=3900 RepID=A0A2Z6NIM3_TRISU|nr:hypothetical protein TSUD_185190 [Trifolium subterraneum]